MGARFPSQVNTTLVNTVLGQNTETAALQSTAVSQPFDTAPILLFWYVVFGVTGSTTTTTLRIRRGVGLTGPVINIPFASAIVAAQKNTLSGVYVDLPGAVGSVVYTISLQTAGQTSVGDIDDGCILALVL